ncbi:protein SUPPRESSOR OF QUENCHING 1, chloroplastic-like isoform X1 [Malus domestica]|uniref:protein SUPPRESSOR OF QUENCHING 1, chloroplastic-like isoform X1 n=1 Tax=Malus domestica TaxID=3750 RepID=UPI0007ED7E64|nr:protein SUPPRESSOR OF QUENCHING 1, chloroplastic-like isoform X1 [Malus domestica]
MEAETETQIMDSNATIYVADGKSFLENSVSESLYQRLNKLHNSSDLNLTYLDKEEAELLTLELKGVRPPVAKQKSLRRRSSADTQTVTVDGGPYPTRATCLLKYQYPKGIIFQRSPPLSSFQRTYTCSFQLTTTASQWFLILFVKFSGVAWPFRYLSPKDSKCRKLAVSLASKLSLKPRFPLIPWMDILVQRISNSSFQETSPSASTGRINCKIYYCKEDE